MEKIMSPVRVPNLYKIYNITIVSLLVAMITLESFAWADKPQEKEAELEIHYTFKPEKCDRKAEVTDLVTLHYKGYLADGQIFDSSHERGEPLTFQIGIGQVILGWDKGLMGVCVGEKRKLVIPPHYGYGEAKHDQIPPKSTLIFDITVEKIEKGPKPANVFKEIDSNGDGRLSRKEVGDFVKHQIKDAKRQDYGDMGAMNDPDHAQMVDEIFMHEDKDRDDYISHEEFSGPKHNHDEL